MIVKAVIFIACYLSGFSCIDEIPLPESEKPLATLISKDKARYSPLETVNFQIADDLEPSTRIRYKYLNEVIQETAYQGKTWSWIAPPVNNRGYMVELYTVQNDREHLHACIAVDVSSNWSRFPRYSFLTDFSDDADTDFVIETLNRYHINVVVFGGWQYFPNVPYPGAPGMPNSFWVNVTGSGVNLHSLLKCIAQVKSHNMITLYHNLAYGAAATNNQNILSETWHLFKDNARTIKDMSVYPKPPFTSDLYVMNPASTGWQRHIAGVNRNIIEQLGFDGWHIDQYGDRGHVYDYNGHIVPLAADFKPFIDFLKADYPETNIVCNAPNQFGQYAISHSATDILFTEVLPPNDTFSDLGRIIMNNNSFSNQTKQSVLAVYPSKSQSTDQINFNTAAVLFSNAVIFSFGGSSLQLNESMIFGSSAFSHDILFTQEELKDALVHYYDFLVAYQNILRDGGVFNRPAILVANRTCCVNHWPPQPGNIVLIGKEIDTRQVIHMINFLDATSLDWHDNSWEKLQPERLNNLSIVHSTNKPVKKIWFASPDYLFGSSVTVDFIQTETKVEFNIPSLKFWSMIVIEY